MGLFDSFLLDDFLKCPKCGATEEGRMREFQTKKLGSFMSCLKVGARAIVNDCFQLIDGQYPVYCSCAVCRCWIDAKAIISNGIFAGIVDIEAKTQQEKWGEYKHVY